MNPDKLEQILHCSTLPSLPAVAVRVLELTADPEVNLGELAVTIQNDQALSTKILRTVNSSFYGLREPCSTIQKALVMLGLGPVKSLVLGFSLVQAIESDAACSFDYVAHWRRAIYSAIAAKLLADRFCPANADEAFLAGLLQDIGVVASYRALGQEYLDVVALAQGDHGQLARHELSTLEIQHGDIGAMLCERWNLPGQLTVPVKYHERPNAAPQQHLQLVRLVALGNTVHDVLTYDETVNPLRVLYKRSNEWLRLTASEADDVVRACAGSVAEVESLFEIETGQHPDADEVLSAAGSMLFEMAKTGTKESYQANRLAELMSDGADDDPLTGAVGRTGFDRAVRSAFPAASAGETPLSLVQIIIDGLASVRTEYGEIPADEHLMGIVGLLEKHFEPLGGIVCRVADSVFPVVIPGGRGSDVRAAVNELLREYPAALKSWRIDGIDTPVPLRLSVGISTYDANAGVMFANPGEFVADATRAAQAARRDKSDGVAHVIASPDRKAA